MPSSDGVVDALAAYAAAEIGDTHELDREGIEVTAIYEAVE